jgi:hypothetical protein
MPFSPITDLAAAFSLAPLDLPAHIAGQFFVLVLLDQGLGL